jgi:hypothetical protein
MNYTRAHGISMAEAVRRGIACLKASKSLGSYKVVYKKYERFQPQEALFC